MELSRAKTVLIFAFLFLNIFLFYHLWQEEGESIFAFGQEEEYFQLEEALESANLEMDVPLPRSGKRVGHLVVKPWQIQRGEAVQAVWNALDFHVDSSSESIEEHEPDLEEERVIISRHSIEDYQLIIRNEGIINLKRSSKTPPEDARDNASQEDIEKAADDFVQSIPFLQDYELDYVQEGDKWLLLNYRQLFDDNPLYAGYLQLSMDGLEPTGFYLYRLQPVGYAEQEREVIPPSTALLRFLESYSGAGRKKSIVDFSLGYYSQEYDAERWEIPPVWRIRLNNGEVYYINAFTGQLER